MMHGKPEDVAGECNAHLRLPDDYGDNTATIRCTLEREHDGLHKAEFNRVERFSVIEAFGGLEPNAVIITWEKDEKKANDE